METDNRIHQDGYTELNTLFYGLLVCHMRTGTVLLSYTAALYIQRLNFQLHFKERWYCNKLSLYFIQNSPALLFTIFFGEHISYPHLSFHHLLNT